MQESLIPFVVIFTLVLVTLRNGSDTPRGLACIAVLWTTVPGYAIYDADIYFPIVETIGSYGYQSLTPLLAIIVLSFIHDKLSTILMSLFTMLILANCYFWWQEGNGNQVQHIQQGFVWAVFAIEVLLMLSPRLTDGIHGIVHRAIAARNIATARYTRNNRTYSTKIDVSENAK